MAAFGHTTPLQRWIFEIIFSIDMIFSCLTEIPPEESNHEPERRIQVIIKDYFSSGNFYWDLVPLIPIQLINMPNAG
jgi:hypothetical protein